MGIWQRLSHWEQTDKYREMREAVKRYEDNDRNAARSDYKAYAMSITRVPIPGTDK